MPRWMTIAACFALAAATGVEAQSISVYQTTPDKLEALTELHRLKFLAKNETGLETPLLTVNDGQKFQEIDGFGASLTDAAAWVFAKKMTAEQTDEAFRKLFSRKNGIAVNFLRQPIGSSDLAVTFYSYDDLCEQTDKACATPTGMADPELKHYSLKHDEEYILPLLKKALAVNPGIHVMLTPWSPPGWMKTSGSMLGSNPETKEASRLKKEFYPAFASYLVKTVQGYEAAGVPVWALSVENEPLYAPPTYSGMKMEAAEQAEFLGSALGPAMSAAGLKTKVMAYDHNWNRPDYPETVLRDAKAGAVVAGTAWHHYEGTPEAMTRVHEEFPQKDEWVTEASGGVWQKENVLAEEATELVAVMRNWSRSYVLWALATDENHGPHVGGCATCRGLMTIDTQKPGDPVTLEPDYYVLGHASKFLLPGAVRIASDEPAGTGLKDAAFRNVDGTVVLYVVNAGEKSKNFRIGFHGKMAATVMPAGAVATFVWK